MKPGEAAVGKSTDGEMTTSKRNLLILLAGLSAIAWGWQRFGVRREQLTFSPIRGLDGWRVGVAGGLSQSQGSATSAVFLGLGEESVSPLPESDLCAALYGEGSSPAVAVFTDFFCPNCRVLEARLEARLATLPGVRLVWHQLPLLGPSSERAAQAAAAAELQGGYDAFRRRLITAPFRPTASFFGETAEAVGLDGNRLIADMEGSEVARRLLTSRRAAETLGIYGTPAFAVGKTLVMGAVQSDTLDQLLAGEAGRTAIC